MGLSLKIIFQHKINENLFCITIIILWLDKVKTSSGPSAAAIEHILSTERSD